MSEKELRSKVIRLAHQKPELRDHLLPLVKSAGNSISLSDHMKNWFEDLGKQVVNLSAKRVTYKNATNSTVFFRIQGHKEMAFLVYENYAFTFSMRGMKGEKRFNHNVASDLIAKFIAHTIDRTEEI